VVSELDLCVDVFHEKNATCLLRALMFSVANLFVVYFLWHGIVRSKRSRPTLRDLVRETGFALDVWLVPHMQLVDASFSHYSSHEIYNGC
jgi:hypothetical protein